MGKPLDPRVSTLGQFTVGVVIPVYNRAAKVLDALNSVAGQSCPPSLLVVVDDGSSDGTYEVVKAWQMETPGLPPFDIMRQSNRGVSAARNAGFARAARCDYVAFLDSDDSWPPEFLERSVAGLSANILAVATSCDRIIIQPGGHSETKGTADISLDAIGWLFHRTAGISSCTLLRSSAVAAVDGFDESLPIGEDTDFFLRISLLGPWVHVPMNPVVFCRDMGGGYTGQQNLSRWFDDKEEQRAAIYDEMFRLLRGSDAEPRSLRVARKGLAHWWYRAGRSLAGRPEARMRALTCYRRGLRWNPTSRQILRSYLACLVRTIGQERVTRRRVALRPLPRKIRDPLVGPRVPSPSR